MIVLRTDDPQGLLDAIYAAIDKADGKTGIKIQASQERVITWGYDEDKHFHHDPDTNNDWASKARFQPKVYTQKGVLVFFIQNTKGADTKFTQPVYGLYHGRFLSMLISHFPDKFTIQDVTTRPFTSDDAWKAYYAKL